MNSEYAPDVKKALSIVVDIDDIGELEMRRLDIEKVLEDVKQRAMALGLQTFSTTFSVREPGRTTIVFVLDVYADRCVLRFAERNDYIDFSKLRQRNLPPPKPGLELPSFDKLDVEDLLCGVNSFLLKDMMES